MQVQEIELEQQSSRSNNLMRSPTRLITKAAITFDTELEQEKQKKKLQSASTVSTLCKLLKVAVGSGVLGMPGAFKEGYLLAGILMNIAASVLQYSAWTVLIKVMEAKTISAVETERINRLNILVQKSKPLNLIQIQTDKEKIENQEALDEYFQNEDSISMLQSEIYTLKQQIIQRKKKQGRTTEEITINMILEEDKKKQIESQELEKKEKEQQILVDIQRKRERSLSLRQEYKDYSIYDLIRKEFKNNKYSLLGLQIVTLIQMGGMSISFLIFFKLTLQDIDPQFNIDWVLCVLGLFLIVLILGFSIFDKLEKLRFFIIIGSYCQLIIIYFIMSICLYQVKLNFVFDTDNKIFFQNYPDQIAINSFVNWNYLPQLFGYCLFSYDVNGVLTEIRQEMKLAYLFKNTLRSSMLIECSIYSFIGVMGYLAYGQYSSSLITINVSVTLQGISQSIQNFFIFLQLIYSFCLIINIVISNVITFRVLTEIIYGIDVGQAQVPYKSQFFIRLVYITVIVTISMAVSQFTIVVSLLGSVTSVILGFVLPYVLFLKFLKEKSSKLRFAINTIVLGFGIIAGFLGLIFTFN